MKKKYKVLLIDDEPSGPEKWFQHALKDPVNGGIDDKYESELEVIEKPEDVTVNAIKAADIILLDLIFDRILEGDKILKFIIGCKKNDALNVGIILFSSLLNYDNWDKEAKLEQFIRTGVDFIHKETAQEIPMAFKFQLDRQVFYLEQEKKLRAQARKIKDQAQELQSITARQISPVPIEIAQQKGPSIEKIAQLDGYKPVQSVFIHGNTGTGKGELVRFFREQLANKRGLSVQDIKFSHVNCASFSKELIMGELFGICQGTATNVSEKNGRFADSDGGILFLDEFEELSLENQAQILTVMETGKYYRAHGGINHKHQDNKECPPSLKSEKPDHTEERSIKDLKLIAAANQNAIKLLYDRKLRRDIFHRFDFAIIMADISEYNNRQLEEMIAVFVDQINNRYRSRDDFKNGKSLTDEAVEKIISKKTKLGGKFGGNLRQVEKWIERALTMTDKREITAEDLEKHYLYYMTSKDHEEFDPKLIVEKLIKDRDKANAAFIEKYDQESFNFLKDHSSGPRWKDLWEKYKPLRNFKIEDNRDYSTEQKVAIAEEMKKALINRGETVENRRTVVMAMGMTENTLKGMVHQLKRKNKDSSA